MFTLTTHNSNTKLMGTQKILLVVHARIVVLAILLLRATWTNDNVIVEAETPQILSLITLQPKLTKVAAEEVTKTNCFVIKSCVQGHINAANGYSDVSGSFLSPFQLSVFICIT